MFQVVDVVFHFVMSLLCFVVRKGRVSGCVMCSESVMLADIVVHVGFWRW